MENPKGIFIAKDSGPVYHYCSPSAFQAICESKKLRFSSLKLSNDSQELILGENLLREGIIRAREQKLNSSALDQLEGYLNDFIKHGYIIGSCFSLVPDVLSQWRGYGDDAEGFCIGFNPILIRNSQTYYVPVLYSESEQILHVDSTIKVYTEGFLNHDRNSIDEMIMAQMVLRCVVQMKNISFAEEKEVRLVAQLINEGNSLDYHKSSKDLFKDTLPPVQFLFKGSTPIPFVDFSIMTENKSAIKEVILGPRNNASIEEIELYLGTLGINNVSVRRSVSSYR